MKGIDIGFTSMSAGSGNVKTMNIHKDMLVPYVYLPKRVR